MTIVFCLPGNSFSGKFLECWTGLLGWCLHNGIRPVLSRQYSSVVYFARNLCLGGDVTRGTDQKPFNGKIPCSHVMWIDSDILFKPGHFQRLLSHEADIVSGLYLMEGGKYYAAVKEWDEEFFRNHGHFRFLTPGDLTGEKGLVDVAYAGLGFMLVKYGVFESLEYPWFRPVMKRIGNMEDFTAEDAGFCLAVKEKGYRIHIDPGVKVGHEKRIVW